MIHMDKLFMLVKRLKVHTELGLLSIMHSLNEMARAIVLTSEHWFLLSGTVW
jgi:hypothetical protein